MGLLSLFQKKRPAGECSAIIVAAGSARRMEGIDKMLASLGGAARAGPYPVRLSGLSDWWTKSWWSPGRTCWWRSGRLCRDFSLDKVRKVIVGGAERMDSVRAGLREIRPDAQLAAIHDGARPLVPQQVTAPGHPAGRGNRCRRPCDPRNRHGQACGGGSGCGDPGPVRPAGGSDPPGV